jgi:hypothetical protein
MMDRKGVFALLLVSALSLFTLVVAIRLDILVLVLGIAIVLIAGALFLSLLLQKPGSLLLIYVLLLPINSLVLAALFRYSGSRLLVAALQPWKELLAILIFIFASLGLMQRMRISGKLHKLDLLIAFFFFLNIVYLALPIGPDLTAKAYGLRGSAFFLLIYLLGRVVPIGTRLQRTIIITLVAIGALGGLLAMFEKALPPTWPADLVGYPAYLFEFFNQEPRGHYGLTWTFETASGLRRSSAFFANPLELASSTLLTGVAALYVMFSYRPRTIGRLLAAICWLLIVVSLLLSVSRASIVAFGIQTVVAALWLGRTRFALFVVGIGFIGMLVLLVLVGPSLTNLITETITFQNPSSQGHLANWIEGFNAIIEQPAGIGLGMSGQVGERWGRKPVHHYRRSAWCGRARSLFYHSTQCYLVYALCLPHP